MIYGHFGQEDIVIVITDFLSSRFFPWLNEGHYWRDMYCSKWCEYSFDLHANVLSLPLSDHSSRPGGQLDQVEKEKAIVLIAIQFTKSKAFIITSSSWWRGPPACTWCLLSSKMRFFLDHTNPLVYYYTVYCTVGYYASFRAHGLFLQNDLQFFCS